MQKIISNGFEATLREVRGGDCLNELSSSLQALVMAVGETGKGGTLTLKLAIKPAGGKGNALLIKGDVGLKLPQMEQEQTIMFATEDGALQRNDPRQKEMPFALRTVPETTETVKPEDLKKVS